MNARPPYTLDDLVSREQLDAGCALPARLAVIGHPVAHSASPRMHRAGLVACGIPLRYIKLDVPEGRLGEAFSRLRELGFVGCNITVPHKLDALRLCDRLDDSAQALGAVNTVRFADDGTVGSNTDGPGFERAIQENFATSLRGLRILLMGAGGGAGQALAAHCARAGADRLVLVNRTAAKLDPLVARLRATWPDTAVHVLTPDSPQLVGVAHQCQLLVNTSSLGLKPEDPSPLPHACFGAHHLVFDSIYQPPHTAFLQAADGAGARTANGAAMLLHQGVLAFANWFDGREPVEEMRAGLAGGDE